MEKEIVWLKKSGQLKKGEPVLTIKSKSAVVKSEPSALTKEKPANEPKPEKQEIKATRKSFSFMLLFLVSLPLS